MHDAPLDPEPTVGINMSQIAGSVPDDLSGGLVGAGQGPRCSGTRAPFGIGQEVVTRGTPGGMNEHLAGITDSTRANGSIAGFGDHHLAARYRMSDTDPATISCCVDAVAVDIGDRKDLGHSIGGVQTRVGHQSTHLVE